jgi:hypothetical protein
MIMMADEIGMCPFTLELCKDCSEPHIIESKKICPFTLEACSLEQGSNLVRRVRARYTRPLTHFASAAMR